MDGPSAAPAPFPSTLWSEVIAARDPASPQYRDRMERLIRRYWKPVFWTLRLRWKQEPDRAADLAQDFFLKILAGEIVATADPRLGRFRAYLRHGLEFFMLDALKADRAAKRGGDRAKLDLDFASGEVPAELAAGADAETLFDRAWAHQLLSDAVTELLQRLPPGEAEAFRALDLGDPATRPSLRDLAAKIGVSKSEVWKRLAEARRKLRAILMERVKEYAADEADLFRELDDLFAG